MTVVLTVLATLGFVLLAAVVVAQTGAVDVAASSDYLPGARWFFSTLSQESIRRHAAAAVAAGEASPPGDAAEAVLRTGAIHYREMCVVCHGAPGADPSEIGEGMKPKPPDLSHAADEWSEAEILWIVEHGIRHTGMPAFGPTHSAEELAAIAAFVARLDGMSAAEYGRLSGSEQDGTSGRAAGGEAAPAHDHGSHPH